MAFNWNLALPGNMTTFLEVVLMSHPFGKEKEV